MSYDYLIKGRSFTLRTDHNNLVWLDKAKEKMFVRWANLISEYDFNIIHVKGEDNQVADALSRVFTFGLYNTRKEGVVEIDPIVQNAFKRVHNSTVGHVGIGQTVLRIKKLLKKEKIKPMSSLRQMVIALISSCMVCRKLRTPRNKNLIGERHSLYGHEPYPTHPR